MAHSKIELTPGVTYDHIFHKLTKALNDKKIAGKTFKSMMQMPGMAPMPITAAMPAPLATSAPAPQAQPAPVAETKKPEGIDFAAVDSDDDDDEDDDEEEVAPAAIPPTPNVSEAPTPHQTAVPNQEEEEDEQ
jgi:hypothetical protein